MRKRHLCLAAVGTALVLLATWYLGCNNNPTSSDRNVDMASYSTWQKVADPEGIFDSGGVHEFFYWQRLTDEASRSAAIVSASSEDVDYAFSWLGEQAYSFVDSNSVILVVHGMKYVSESSVDLQSQDAASKPYPGNNMVKLIHADTMVWRAFENPRHDMANHTGLVTVWRNGGVRRTLLAELDVSHSLPSVIRQGVFQEGSFVPGDAGVDGFLRCLGEGTSGGLIGCALTNCAYFNCVGGAAAGSAIVCGVISIVSWFGARD